MRLLLLLIAFSLAMGVACSSSTNGGDNGKVSAIAGNRTSSPTTSAGATNNDNALAATSGESDNANLTERREQLRHRPTNVDQGGSAAPLEYRPAPENSQIATTMNTDGQPVQVRAFKTDPKIARVEAIWLGPKEKQLKITLRDGRVVDVKTDKIADLASASAAELASLAAGSK